MPMDKQDQDKILEFPKDLEAAAENLDFLPEEQRRSAVESLLTTIVYS